MYPSNITEIAEGLILAPKDKFPIEVVRSLLGYLRPAADQKVAEEAEEVKKILVLTVIARWDTPEFIAQLVKSYEPYSQATDDPVIKAAKRKFLSGLSSQAAITTGIREAAIIFIEKSSRLGHVQAIVATVLAACPVDEGEPLIQTAIARAGELLVPEPIKEKQVSAVFLLLEKFLTAPLSAGQLNNIIDLMLRLKNCELMLQCFVSNSACEILGKIANHPSSNVGTLVKACEALVALYSPDTREMIAKHQALFLKLLQQCQALVLLPEATPAEMAQVCNLYHRMIDINIINPSGKSKVCGYLVNLLQSDGFQILAEQEKAQFLAQLKTLTDTRIAAANKELAKNKDIFENLTIKIDTLVLCAASSRSQEEITTWIETFAELKQQIRKLANETIRTVDHRERRRLEEESEKLIFFKLIESAALLLNNTNVTPENRERLMALFFTTDFLRPIISATRRPDFQLDIIPAFVFFSEGDWLALQGIMPSLRGRLASSSQGVQINDYRSLKFLSTQIDEITKAVSGESWLLHVALMFARHSYNIIVAPKRTAELLSRLPQECVIETIIKLSEARELLLISRLLSDLPESLAVVVTNALNSSSPDLTRTLLQRVAIAAPLDRSTKLISILPEELATTIISSLDSKRWLSIFSEAVKLKMEKIMFIVAGHITAEASRNSTYCSEAFHFSLNALHSGAADEQKPILIALLLRLLIVSPKNLREELQKSFTEKLAELNLEPNVFDDLLSLSTVSRPSRYVPGLFAPDLDAMIEGYLGQDAQYEMAFLHTLYDSVCEKITARPQTPAVSSR